MNKLIKFLIEVKEELKKVTWPSQQKKKIATVAVIVFTLIVSVYLWVCDLAFSRILDYLFK